MSDNRVHPALGLIDLDPGRETLLQQKNPGYIYAPGKARPLAEIDTYLHKNLKNKQ